MKKKYIISALLIFILNINTISAACTQEEINEFKKIEDEYKVTYNFNQNTKKYKIKFTASMPDKYYYKISV